MNASSKKILVVEDSKMFGYAISAKIEAELGCKPHLVTSFAEACNFFEQHGDGLFAAVLDLVLPDAPQGEVVGVALKKNIPAIVLTGQFSESVRKEFTSRDIVDYIVKEGPNSLDQLTQTLRRLEANRSVKVLIVDDDKLSRLAIKRLLERHRFVILEAENGKKALETLKEHPDIRVVISDYFMPEMDGFELVSRIRETTSMDKMAIIGISSKGGPAMTARFLKKGANDFIVKPFTNEEFYLRINQNVQMLEYIESIRNAAIKDHLTGLYNRRYLFELGQKLFGNAQRYEKDLVVAMIDIDKFKTINDRFGHAVGDEVLRWVSAMMMDHFRSSDVVARMGGEEFCILAPDMPSDHGRERFEALRATIESTPLSVKGSCIRVTVSIGITATLGPTLEATINQADQLLYQAKNKGRNRVIVG